MANHKQDHCDYPDCDRPHAGKGYCRKHYLQNRNGTLGTAIERNRKSNEFINPNRKPTREDFLEARAYPPEWYDGLWEFVKQELNLTQPERKKNDLASL